MTTRTANKRVATDKSTDNRQKSTVDNDIDDIFSAPKKQKANVQQQTATSTAQNDGNGNNSDDDSVSDTELNSDDEQVINAADDLDDDQVTQLIAQAVKSAKQRTTQQTGKQTAPSTKTSSTVHNNTSKKTSAAPEDDFGFTRNSTQRNTGRGYTDDGYKIYTAEELKVNMPNSGSTPDCPFDCTCCF